MIFVRLTKKPLNFVVFLLVLVCVFAGCAKHNYKAEADETVYKIIDQKWKDDFGPKANYKVSDVAPGPNDIKVERIIPASGVLTLPNAVAIATVYNRDYHLQKELLYTKALDLRLTRHEFETKFFGGFSGGYNADRNDEILGAEANIGFNRLLATGTNITTKVGAAWIDVLRGNMEGGLASILTAIVTQPLLRGRDRTVVMEMLTQAERNTLYQVRLFNRFRQQFVVLVITQYYTALQLADAAKIAKDNYETLSWLCERTEKLANAGRLPKYEVDGVRQEKLQAWDDYIEIEKEYKLALDTLKITLGVPTTAEFKLDERELEALRAARMKYPDFLEAEGVETGLFRRLDLANTADAIIDAQRKVYVATDALQADASIVGTTDVVSSGHGSRQTLKAEENYKIDLGLDLPLDRVAEQNVYRKALLTLNQRQREYELLADTIALEVRTAYRDLVEAAERHRLQFEALKLAQKRFKDAMLLMQYARVSSRRVLDAQRDLFDAQTKASEALVAYAVAMLNFYRDTGVLQVRPDGMWEL